MLLVEKDDDTVFKKQKQFWRISRNLLLIFIYINNTTIQRSKMLVGLCVILQVDFWKICWKGKYEQKDAAGGCCSTLRRRQKRLNSLDV